MAVVPTLSLTEQALLLPVEERLKLAEKLLLSLNGPVDPEIEAAWAEEVEARFAAVLAGKEKLIPHEEVVAEIQARYGF